MLRCKRKTLQLSQIDASKLLGISNAYLSQIENKNRTNLNKHLINKICYLYEISEDDFLNFINSPK